MSFFDLLLRPCCEVGEAARASPLPRRRNAGLRLATGPPRLHGGEQQDFHGRQADPPPRRKLVRLRGRERCRRRLVGAADVEYVGFLASQGFNAVRVPLAMDNIANDPTIEYNMVKKDSFFNGIAHGRTSLEALDRLVALLCRGTAELGVMLPWPAAARPPAAGRTAGDDAGAAAAPPPARGAAASPARSRRPSARREAASSCRRTTWSARRLVSKVLHLARSLWRLH